MTGETLILKNKFMGKPLSRIILMALCELSLKLSFLEDELELLNLKSKAISAWVNFEGMTESDLEKIFLTTILHLSAKLSFLEDEFDSLFGGPEGWNKESYLEDDEVFAKGEIVQ